MSTLSVELLPSPWSSTLFDLVRSVKASLFVASPFLSAGPLNRIAQIINEKDTSSARVDIVTNLSVDHLLSGSLDVAALLRFKQHVPHSSVIYLPSLHAKVYIADSETAVVTSGNLTNNGLSGNREYGVLLRDTEVVARVRSDLTRYAALGNEVSLDTLGAINEATQELKIVRQQVDRSINAKLRAAFRRKTEATHLELLKARAQGNSTHRIFYDTILYLLESKGPLRTAELHPLIQQIHPDLCDDSIDRIVGGVHFGKKWKHHVRGAQVSLRRQGRINYDNGLWSSIVNK